MFLLPLDCAKWKAFFTSSVSFMPKLLLVPVLLQWGDRDIYVTEKETKDIFQNLSSKQKQLIIYPGANHESLLQYDPIGWQKNVNDFIGSLPK